MIPEKDIEAWKLQKQKLKTKKEKQYYAEALKFGYCLVFHVWPKDAEDADVDYEAPSVHAEPGESTTKRRKSRSKRKKSSTAH